MALSQLLLVDDSEAILAYERASLGDRYALTVARDGVEAMERLRGAGGALPDLIVLDLSMPRLDGEGVLAAMRDDPVLRDIPVVLVSTESKRARSLVDRQLVAAFLPKPIEAPALRALVERVLEEARWRRSRAGLTILRVVVGPHMLAFPITAVRSVVAQPLATVIAGAPAYLRELIDVQGEAVAVLDLARRLGVDASAAYLDRSLVIVQAQAPAPTILPTAASPSAAPSIITGTLSIAIAVDAVLDPEIVPAEHVLPADRLGGSVHGSLEGLFVAVARVGDQLVPVLRGDAFLSRGLFRDLADAIAQAPRTVAALGPDANVRTQ